MKRILLLSFIMLVWISNDTIAKESDDYDVYYPWVDRLRVYPDEDLKGTPFYYLSEGEPVYGIIRYGKELYYKELRGLKFYGSYAEVILTNGQTGWVYFNALSKKYPKVDDYELYSYREGYPFESHLCTLGETNTQYILMMEGHNFHDRFEDYDGKTWYGLYFTENEFMIEPVRLQVLTNEESDRMYEYRIDALLDGIEPIFLINHLPENTEPSTAIETYFWGKATVYNFDYSYHFEEKGPQTACVNNYLFRFDRIVISNFNANFYVEIEDTENDRCQIVTAIGDGEHRQYLLWMGDLDQDGKADVLLDMSDHYASTKHGLYLSSTAKEGYLFGPPSIYWISWD